MTRRVVQRCLVTALIVASTGPVAAQQLGGLLSPGPLSAAHAHLEGIGSCEKCHEPGKGISAARCLDCHEAVATRIRERRGVHRDVDGDCEACHTEHAGRDAEIRPFDPRGFDHHEEAGFALDGRHAGVPCEKCHTTRSYLKLDPDCASCHRDVHQGALGPSCSGCHTTSGSFVESGRGFDHDLAAFPLVGAHTTVSCEKCHRNKTFRGISHGQCSDCHDDPHRGKLGPDCAGCHTPTAWRTGRIDHARTGFPLEGLHATVPCADCHRQPATKVEMAHAECRDCHSDPHRGSFVDDCAACHSVDGFAGAEIDHLRRTGFPLADRHAEIECVACHRQAVPAEGPGAGLPVDFRGLQTACVACHSDPHAGRLGADCSACHGTRAFQMASFEHPRFPDFFAGEHARVDCAGCHRDATEPGAADSPVSSRRYRGLPTDCVTCHRDVHLGQLGDDCARCHAVDAADFAAPGFDHARAGFRLSGRHTEIDCVTCHKQETGEFPAGRGTAVRFTGMRGTCESCHTDPHLGQLGDRCQDCHSTMTFRIPTFDHEGPQDFFGGEHTRLECDDCHRSADAEYPSGRGTAVRYADLDRECVTCHEDAHDGALGATCSTCHSVDGPFRTASRAFHKGSMFPLEGRHLVVPCAECHWDGVIEGTPTRCYDCHWIRRQDDRYRTRLGNECEDCHRPTSWTAVTWEHGAATGEPLLGVHSTLDCDSCHRGGLFEQTVPTDCVECHLSDYEGADEPDHAQAAFPTDCQLCHSPGDSSWELGRFDHGVYPLVGTHAAQPCSACHDSGVYAGLPSDCVDCHQSDYDGADEPDHALAGFPTDCTQCHRAADASWDLGQFDHGVYPLVGTHAAQPCSACHDSGVYSGLPSDCVDCHQGDYDAADEPDHALAGFPTDCTQCHRAADASWDLGQFDHGVYPLVGTHAAQPCSACHDSGVYAGLPSDCVDCHQDDYDDADEPDHALAGFPTDCTQCHRAADASWDLGQFDHGVYPLVGTHAAQPCSACHDSGVYAGLPSDCVDCHQGDYDGADDPDHAMAGFPTDCTVCHRAADASWDLGQFDHGVYPLVGTHAAQPCSACHDSGVYAGLPSDCVDCHQDDYDAADEPDHAMAGFPTDCTVCHRATDASWDLGQFDHGVYPLVGNHAAQPCSACHDSGVYAGLPSDCVDCHQDDYDDTDDPDHAMAGFPTDCTVCHRAADASWDLGQFDHGVYPLVGTHATQPCSACHDSGVYAGLPSDCVDCHLDDYDGTDDPDHALAGFPTDCQLCHNASDPGWDDGDFDHGVYPLVGTHATQPCSACHDSGVYTGLPSDCVDCHQDDYDGTDDPDHALAGFPTDCQLCHDASDPDWDDGDFDHGVYPLVGTHATQPCSACHDSGVYSGLPSDCVDCHQDDYDGTDDPDHALAGFPTDCQLCHDASDPDWDDGDFDHGVYPLVGTHATQPCSACHDSGVYVGLPSDCVDCHLDDYNGTDDPDHALAGFPTDCQLCHDAADPDWDDGDFDHAVIYPLQGAHTSLDCAACHGGGTYQGTPRECVGCHLDDFNGTDDPNHVAAGFPTDCELCHRPSHVSWDQAVFAHPDFPINGGDHAGNPCSACHPNSNNFGVFTCTTSCHPRSEMDDEHDDVSGYVYDSPACYSCHPNGEEPGWEMVRSHGRTR